MHDIELDALMPMVARPGSTALIFDFDGTLVDYQRDPAQVSVLPATRAAVVAAAERFAHTAIITGRSVAELQRHLPEVTTVAGIYGAEVCRPGTSEPWRDPDFFRRAADVAALVAGWHERLVAAGVVVQEQGPTRMLHWGGLTGDRRDAAVTLAKAVAAAAEGQGLLVRPLSGCLDIRPGHIDKRIGMMRIVDRGARTAAVYFGDDVYSDLDAFAATRKLFQDACCVAVVHDDRPENEPLWRAADLRVRGVRGVRGLVAYLAAAAG
jgi:trehalose 6-phosphate phosphatase